MSMKRTQPHKSKDKLRLITELLFLLLFIQLLRNQALQAWILVFGISLVLAVLFSRLYCAWVCPMALLFRPVDWLFDKLRIRRFSVPHSFSKPWIRWVILALFIGTMVMIRALELRINLLAYIVIASVLITLLFAERFWHGVLCPYGSLLHIAAKPARFTLRIEHDACIGCGQCAVVCLNNAVTKLAGQKQYHIRKEECLTCFKCQDVCPVNAIHYTTSSDTTTLQSEVDSSS